MDGGTWWATVHGVAKSQTLSDFTSFLKIFIQKTLKKKINEIAENKQDIE